MFLRKPGKAMDVRKNVGNVPASLPIAKSHQSLRVELGRGRTNREPHYGTEVLNGKLFVGHKDRGHKEDGGAE